MTDFPHILGVYSSKKETEIGLGDTATKRETLIYWYVRQIDEDRFETQPLNIYHVPSGVKKEVSAKVFLSEYNPEPNYYKINTQPALNSLAAKIAKGEDLFGQGKLDEAEKQFIKALMIDDVNVKANYGLGKVASEQKDYQKLKKVLGKLLNLDEAFNQEFREQFNGFGISLRKNKYFDDALKFYGRALELGALDEHIYFNMARAYFDKNDFDQAVVQLNIALSINPEFEEAKKFLEYCMKSGEEAGKAPPA
jgi:tetratricopeptide (TPR) repeat protein